MVKELRLIVVSGLSGAGKSYTIKCLEDLGFFCVDNLPPPLLPKFVELCQGSGTEIRKIALGVDIRGNSSASSLQSLISCEGRTLADEPLLGASEVLVRRFSEVGGLIRLLKSPVRRHPDGDPAQPLRDRSDRIMDTASSVSSKEF